MKINLKSRAVLPIVLLGVLLLTSIGVSGYLILQEFGHFQTADDLSEYEKLPYFQNGRFQSPEPLYHKSERAVRGPTGFWRFIFPQPYAFGGKFPMVELTRTSFPEKPEEFAVYWLGHSSMILELGGKRFLVDPVFGNAAPVPGIVRRYVKSPIKREDLPPIDYVILTHDHYDHLEYSTMRYFTNERKSTRFIVPLGVEKHLEKWGISADRIEKLGWDDTFGTDSFLITAEKTAHFSGRTYKGRNTTLWTSYVLEQTGGGKRIYIGGDSGYGKHFKEIGDRYGGFDVAFLETDAWNNVWAQTHMFPDQVLQAYKDLKARSFVPIHWGVFDLAQHPWNETILMLQMLTEQRADINMLTPRMGEKLIPGMIGTTDWWNIR